MMHFLTEAPIALFVQLVGIGLGGILILRLSTVLNHLEKTAAVPAELRAQACDLHQQIESLSSSIAEAHRADKRERELDRSEALAVYRNL